jgi:hypothetical protein
VPDADDASPEDPRPYPKAEATKLLRDGNDSREVEIVEEATTVVKETTGSSR